MFGPGSVVLSLDADPFLPAWGGAYRIDSDPFMPFPLGCKAWLGEWRPYAFGVGEWRYPVGLGAVA